MEEIILLIFITTLIIIAVVASFVTKKSHKKSISPKNKNRYLTTLSNLEYKSISERMIECDKILSHVLSDLGYQGSVADKLKKSPWPIKNQMDEVWRLHKIRNRVAHDIDSSAATESDAQAFEKIIRGMLSRV